MNMQSNTGVRCNSNPVVCHNIRSSVSVLGDSICQVSSDSMSIVRCHISGARYQVSSDNMSSTGVRYQVSEIRRQVPVSYIKCQRLGVKYNISVPTSYINSYSDVSRTKSHSINY